MVKTLSSHLKRKNSKYPPQKSPSKLPTLKVKTWSAHLNGKLSAHLKRENLKCPPQSSKP